MDALNNNCYTDAGVRILLLGNRISRINAFGGPVLKISTNRNLVRATIAIACAGWFSPLLAAETNFWDPNQYPSLSPVIAYHIFDSKLNPLTTSIEELNFHISLSGVSYCLLDGIDLSNKATLHTRLVLCDQNLIKDPEGKPTVIISENQIDLILKTFDFVSHYPNDNYGFSATLLRNRDTGKAILAVRGVEYKPATLGGGREQDLLALNQFRSAGISFGQASSAKDYVSRLMNEEQLKRGEQITVVGMDLGAHIAFLLNEFFPGLADKIVSFKGIGYPRIAPLQNNSKPNPSLQRDAPQAARP